MIEYQLRDRVPFREIKNSLEPYRMYSLGYIPKGIDELEDSCSKVEGIGGVACIHPIEWKKDD